jgi:hypothetical protein
MLLICYIIDWAIVVASLCKFCFVLYKFAPLVFDIFSYGLMVLKGTINLYPNIHMLI